MQDLSIEWTKPPTYLFSYQRFQRASETKATECALTYLARPASITSDFSSRLFDTGSLSNPVWRTVVRLSAAGEGVLRLDDPSRNTFFQRKEIFLGTAQNSRFSVV